MPFKSRQPGPSGLVATAKTASRTLLASAPSVQEGNTKGGVSQDEGQHTDDQVGTSLDWTEDDARSILYIEKGPTEKSSLPSSASRAGTVYPTFTVEEAAIAASLDTPRSGRCQDLSAFPGFKAATSMEVADSSVATLTTLKARDRPSFKLRDSYPLLAHPRGKAVLK